MSSSMSRDHRRLWFSLVQGPAAHLSQSDVSQPFAGHPHVPEAGQQRVSHRAGVAPLLDGQTNFLSVHSVSQAQSGFQFRVGQFQQDLRYTVG